MWRSAVCIYVAVAILAGSSGALESVSLTGTPEKLIDEFCLRSKLTEILIQDNIEIINEKSCPAFHSHQK